MGGSIARVAAGLNPGETSTDVHAEVHPEQGPSAFLLPGVERSFFTVRAEGEGRCVRVALSGTADLRSQLAFDSFLASLHRKSVAVAADEVRMDLRRLEFMSAACFRLIVEWLGRVDEAACPYRVSFLANPQLQWQRRSMDALSSFAGGFVSVITET
jgi:hypothetical protein